MNGSDVKTFLDGYEDVARNLRHAHEILMGLRPHMRDYYVQADGEDNHRMACLMHGIQVSRLEKTMDEVEAMRVAILDQVKP
jgi:hypothetical protein